MYSIIELNRKQYKVEPGKQIIVDRLPHPEDQQFTIDTVLLYRDNDQVKVGTPFIKGVTVKARVMGEQKGKKLRVFKYKKRKGYRRSIGSRPRYTRILIEEIKSGE
ncbi:MAG: 50S ribosomal protein L21 [Spirochaetota bacterium]